MLWSLLSRMQPKLGSHILLYHSTYSQVPSTLGRAVHNITPEEMHKQLLWYKRYFDFVDLDSFMKRPSEGKVAITFDDAYESVFSEAVPLLLSLSLPSTIYINGSSLEGKAFWRDKIRFLMNRGLVGEFLRFREKEFPAVGRLLKEKSFYMDTKDPRINNAELDQALNAFLALRGIDQSELAFLVKDKATLINHPLVTYGNHTFNHYVLSSLTDEQQEREIAANHELISGLKLRLSRIFSIPFGYERHFNAATLEIIRRYGYTGFLYSRNRINFGSNTKRIIGQLDCAERHQMEPDFKSFHKHMAKLLVKALVPILDRDDPYLKA
jgi:peptidoglycan/xylan/chitin deacetylase (PgdA/CDA1 family)